MKYVVFHIHSTIIPLMKPILSFFIGLLVAAIVAGVGYVFYYFHPYPMWTVVGLIGLWGAYVVGHVILHEFLT
jgi:hypothetical protein